MHFKVPFFILFYLLVGSYQLFAETNVNLQKPRLTEDTEYIMEMRLPNGQLISEAIVVYKFDDTWYIPLGEVSNLFGLSLSYSPMMSRVEGRILNVHESFVLDLKKCVVNGKKIAQCLLVIESKDDVYVGHRLISQWMSSKFQIDELKLILVVDINPNFPLMQRLERESNARRMQRGATHKSYDYGHKVVDPSFKLLDGFFIDQDLSYSLNRQNRVQKSQISHRTDLSTSIASFSTRGSIIGVDDQINNLFLNMKKSASKKKTMLGPLKVREIQLAQLYLPNIELVGSGGEVMGSSITNMESSSGQSFHNHILRGRLLPGWEVELYANDILIGRKVGEQSGKFEFDGIELAYGINRFKLVFYGPYGQEEVEYKTLKINSKFKKSKELFYHATVGIDKNGQLLTALKFEKNIKKKYFLGLSTSELFLEDDQLKHRYLNASMATFGTNYLLGLNTSKDLSFGENFNLSLSFLPMKYLNLSLDYFMLNNFRSALFNSDNVTLITEQMKATISLSIPFRRPLLTRTTIVNNTYETGYTNLEIKNHLQLSFRYISFLNELDYKDPEKYWSDKFSIRTSIYKNRLKFALMFRQYENLSSWDFMLRRGLSHNYNLNIQFQNYMFANFQTVNLGIFKYLKRFQLGLTGSYMSTGDYALTTQLSYGLACEPRQKKLYIKNHPVSSAGSATILVFHDKNLNNVYDEDQGELPLTGIGVRAIQRSQTIISDRNGLVFFTDLYENSPVDFTIDNMTIKDINQKATVKGLRVWPAAGAPSYIELPIATFGTLDGTVYKILKGKSREWKLVKIELYDVKEKLVYKTVSDFEGYYIFENIAPGEYKIVAKTKYRGKTLFKQLKISIPTCGDYISDNNFNFKL